MRRSLIITVTLLVTLAGLGEPARILAIFPLPGKSHFISYSNLLDELARRGHQVTVVSAFPKETPLQNYRDIAVENSFEAMVADNEELDVFKTKNLNNFALMFFFWSFTIDTCETFLNYPPIQKLIHTDEEFDLIIYEPFFTECVYGFMHKFKVPFIQISSNSMTVWMGDGVGNPFFFSYIPEIILGLSDRMTFRERLWNSIFGTYTVLTRQCYVLPRMEAIMRKYFTDPSLPSIPEIEANASFLLLNSHVSINYPRPLTPNTAEVGGMHIKEPKKLPKNLQQFLDEAPHGVIYFSLGSVAQCSLMPEAIRSVLLSAFSQVKQRVLWRCDVDNLPGKPGNVLTEEWLPQNDILAHPNVKVFMTHGGLLSTQEATHHGVPLVALPIEADQKMNSLHAQAAGYAVVLDIDSLTAETLYSTLNEVLTNPSYSENAKRLSILFKDQPQKPLDRAVFWVEYVLRHNGAPHMRSAALDLNFFQYYLLDVIAVVVLCSLTIFVITILSCKALCRHFFSGKKNTKNISKSKKEK